MPDLVPVTSAGLSSLSGFAYQIKIFVLLLSRLELGQQVEFETLDDVAINTVPSNDKQEDMCIKREVDVNKKITVFQVKQTKVTETVGRRILYNWFLALHEEPRVSKFVLYVEQGYLVNSKLKLNRKKKFCFEYVEVSVIRKCLLDWQMSLSRFNGEKEVVQSAEIKRYCRNAIYAAFC